MLVLTRRLGEQIVIDGHIRIVVLETKGGKVRIGVEAPADVRVDRLEIHELRVSHHVAKCSTERAIA